MRGINEVSTFTATITDVADHYLPDTASGAEGYDIRGQDRASIIVANAADQEVSLSLEAAAYDDPTFNDGVEIATATAAAGGGDAILSMPPEIVAPYLRLVASYATAPTGGDLTAKFMAERHG